MENRICPKCKKKYQEYPALSRVDNKTEICPSCGRLEAIESVLNKDREEKPTYYIKFFVLTESLGDFDVGIVKTTRTQTAVDLYNLGFSAVISKVKPKNEENVPVLKEGEWRKYARDFIKHSGLKRVK